MHIELGKSYIGKGLLILNQNQLHNAPTAPLLSRHERPDGHQRHEGRVQHKSQEQLEGHERPQQPWTTPPMNWFPASASIKGAACHGAVPQPMQKPASASPLSWPPLQASTISTRLDKSSSTSYSSSNTSTNTSAPSIRPSTYSPARHSAPQAAPPPSLHAYHFHRQDTNLKQQQRLQPGVLSWEPPLIIGAASARRATSFSSLLLPVYSSAYSPGRVALEPY